MKPVDGQHQEQPIVGPDNENLVEKAQQNGVLPAGILLCATILLAPRLIDTWSWTGATLAYLVATLAWLILWKARLSLRFSHVLLIGLFLRLLVFLQPPELSPDVYRYLWDGRVSQHGINPYSMPPDHETLRPLRTAWHSNIEHAAIPTTYPPLAQHLFILAAIAGGTLTVWKVMLLLLDLGTIALLHHSDGTTALAYATFPLVIFEGFWSAHVEIAAVAFLVASYAAIRSHPALSGLSAGIAVGIKLIPVAAIPALFSKTSGTLRFLIAFAVILTVPALPFLATGSFMSGFDDYTTRWSFNSPFYEALLTISDQAQLGEQLKSVWTRIKDPLGLEAISPFVYAHLYDELIVRGILAVGLIAALTALFRQSRERLDLLMARSIALLLIFSPTIHPWYWLAIVPFALMSRSAFLISLPLCAPASYMLYQSSRFAGEVYVLCYGIPALIAFIMARRRKARDRELLRTHA